MLNGDETWERRRHAFAPAFLLYDSIEFKRRVVEDSEGG